MWAVGCWTGKYVNRRALARMHNEFLSRLIGYSSSYSIATLYC